jgi:hypothetical protein
MQRAKSAETMASMTVSLDGMANAEIGNDRYEKEFDQVQDVFELQRNLNNAFAYDLVPSPTVITAALRAARRVNDFPTAVRIFEGISTPLPSTVKYITPCNSLLIRVMFGVRRHQSQSREPDAIR